MILDGRAIANDIYESLVPQYAALGRKVRLGIVVVGDDPVIASFVRIKERAALRLNVEFVKRELPDSATTEEVLVAIEQLVNICDAVIPQLPMPKQIDFERVLASIQLEKDVDALNHTTPIEKRIVHEPVALAVLELLERGGIDVREKHAVVVGAGRLVGAPTARMLEERGAQVEIVTRRCGSFDSLKDADIIVSGTGVPCLIKPEMIKNGVALIDAGTSELSKKVVGDVDPACAEIASVFTPVPGGVGPVAVAMIYRNLLMLVSHQPIV